MPPGLAVTPMPGRTGALLDGAEVILPGEGEAAGPLEAEFEALGHSAKPAGMRAASTMIFLMILLLCASEAGSATRSTRLSSFAMLP